ncbi:MAG: DUF2207 domain-containing protein, partial [Atopobiaceae bacterium]|nr:DUF2207 domain-containing protein [Atopobiaceae bacterium]
MAGSLRFRLSRVCMLFALACALVLALPTRALADDEYSLDATGIWATVDTSGTLTVTEQRLVDFDGNFHGFYWELSTRDCELGEVSVDVVEAGEVDDGGSFVPYTYASSGDDEGTWTLREKSSYDRVDVHFDKTDERAVFYVTYTIDGVVARWSDTGELYWKFVGDNWEEDSHNVECHVFFAGAPEGTQLTAGENIRGWLHNRSLNGTIEVPSGAVPAWDDMEQGDPGTVSATLGKVRSDEFAEVRVAFPAEWLSGAKQRSETRLDTILTEEAGWADAANARFERVGLLATIKKWVYTIMGALSVVAAALMRIGYRRTHKAVFDDKYFRDVPSDDHPAVLHMLYTGSAGSGPDFTATLMRLNDMGALTLEKTTSLKKRLGRKPKEEEDWLLIRVDDRAAKITDPIDR